MQDILSFIQNHAELATGIAIVIGLIAIFEFIRLKQGAKRVNPQQLTQMVNREDAVILDVRSNDLFKTGHIVGAICIPLSELENKYKKLDKYKTKPLILTCASGLDSLKAATLLNKYGLNPLILAGGIRTWREADMPLVKD